MARTTIQAIALTHAFRLSGRRMTDEFRRRTYRCKTETKQVPYRDHETLKVTGYYSEYGDATLTTFDDLTAAEAEALARHLAACGFSATVYPWSDGRGAWIMADSGYKTAGHIRIYEDTALRSYYEEAVTLDEALRDAVWNYANKVAG